MNISRIAHWHFLVSVAVQNINALLEVVLLDGEYVARAARAPEHGFSSVFGEPGTAGSGWGDSLIAEIAGGWSDCRKFAGETCAEQPRAVTAHRVPTEPTAARVIHQVRACVRDGFGEVDTAPVVPGETDRTSVRGAYHVRFLLGRKASSHLNGFRVGTVQIEEDARDRVAVRTACGGGHQGVVLRTAVNCADASDDPRIGGGDGNKIHAERVEDRAVARGERHLCAMIAAGGARRERRETRGEGHFLLGERGHDMEVDPSVLLGEVTGNTDACPGKRLHGGIHDQDSHGCLGVVASYERGREDVTIGDECRSGWGTSLAAMGFAPREKRNSLTPAFTLTGMCTKP